MLENRRDAMQTATRPQEPTPCPPPVPPDEAVHDRPREAGDTTPGPEELRHQRAERTAGPRDQRQLPLRTRIILGTVGGLLVVLGIAGLFLPFLQGILFLVLAAAVLSLTSRRIYFWLQKTIGDRWPQAWQRVERFRTRVRWKLRKK